MGFINSFSPALATPKAPDSRTHVVVVVVVVARADEASSVATAGISSLMTDNILVPATVAIGPVLSNFFSVFLVARVG